MVESLGRLGVQVLDRAGELRNLLSSSRAPDLDWSESGIWLASARRRLHSTCFARSFPRRSRPRFVRHPSWKFETFGSAYLPGGVVSASDPERRGRLIDTAFHREELELLTELGAVAQPVSRTSRRKRLGPRLPRQIQDSVIASAKGAKPQLEKLDIVGEAPPWPLEPLRTSRRRSRSRAHYHRAGDDDRRPSGRSATDERELRNQSFPHPVDWSVHQHGRLETVFGPMAPAHACWLRMTSPTTLCRSLNCRRLLPAALQIKTEPEELPPEAWE